MKRSTFQAAIFGLVWSATVILGCVVADAEQYWADFNTRNTNLDITANGAAYTDQEGGCCRLLHRNQSSLTGSFHLDSKPSKATLTLQHLSSIDKSQPLWGTSPITIRINGYTVLRDFDPDHPMTTNTFRIAKFLRSGSNSFEIKYGNGTTHYWIHHLRIATDE